MAIILWRGWNTSTSTFSLTSNNQNLASSNGVTGGTNARFYVEDRIPVEGLVSVTVSMTWTDDANVQAGLDRSAGFYTYSGDTDKYRRSIWIRNGGVAPLSEPGATNSWTITLTPDMLRAGETYVKPVAYFPTGSGGGTVTLTDITVTVVRDPEPLTVPETLTDWRVAGNAERTLTWPNDWVLGTNYSKSGTTVTGVTGVTAGSVGAGERILPGFYPSIERNQRFRLVATFETEQDGALTYGPYAFRYTNNAYAFVRSEIPRLSGSIPFTGGERHTIATPWITADYSGDDATYRLMAFFSAQGSAITIYDMHYEVEQEITREDYSAPTVRVTAYDVLGDRIGQLPDVIKCTVTQPRNDVSSLTLEYAPSGVRADVLTGAVELGVEWSYTGGRIWEELPNGRFISQSMECNAVDDGTKAISFKGIHIGHMLEEAVLWEVPQDSQDSDGKWNFLSRNAGTILRTVWDAAVARGWGDGLTLDVTPSKDSAGEDWATITTLAFDKTITLGKVLGSLTDIGMIDWVWEGRTLRVYNADATLTRDRSGRVLWPYAVGTTSAPESKSWADLCTDVLIKGEGGNVWTIHNDRAPAGLRRIEKVVEAGGVETEATARMVAEATLQSGANVAEEIKREWTAAEIRWWPWVDYRVGEWVGVQRASGVEKLQVAQISVTYDNKGVSGHTTFGTLLDDVLSRMAKKQKGIVGAASIAGNTTRPADTASKRTPAAPAGLVGRTTPYTIATGAERAILELSWAPVAADTRGNALDGIEYEVLIQVDGEERLWPMGSEPNGRIEGLYVGDTYNVYVRAKATGEGTLSDWSEGITVTPSGDNEAPPVPASPFCRSNLAVLTATWNGTDADGDAMPDDFSHLELSVTAVAATPVVVARTYSPEDREINVPGLSAGTYEVRLRAWDTTGHVSDWSDYATVTVAALVDSDTLREELEIMLPEITDASAIYQRAAALVAGGDVKWGPYPPDDGVPGKTFWIAPDGKLWIMKSKSANVRSKA